MVEQILHIDSQIGETLCTIETIGAAVTILKAEIALNSAKGYQEESELKAYQNKLFDLAALIEGQVHSLTNEVESISDLNSGLIR